MSSWALVGRPSECLININEVLGAHGMGREVLVTLRTDAERRLREV